MSKNLLGNSIVRGFGFGLGRAGASALIKSASKATTTPSQAQHIDNSVRNSISNFETQIPALVTKLNGKVNRDGTQITLREPNYYRFGRIIKYVILFLLLLPISVAWLHIWLSAIIFSLCVVLPIFFFRIKPKKRKWQAVIDAVAANKKYMEYLTDKYGEEISNKIINKQLEIGMPYELVLEMFGGKFLKEDLTKSETSEIKKCYTAMIVGTRGGTTYTDYVVFKDGIVNKFQFK